MEPQDNGRGLTPALRSVRSKPCTAIRSPKAWGMSGVVAAGIIVARGFVHWPTGAALGSRGRRTCQNDLILPKTLKGIKARAEAAGKAPL